MDKKSMYYTTSLAIVAFLLFVLVAVDYQKQGASHDAIAAHDEVATTEPQEAVEEQTEAVEVTTETEEEEVIEQEPVKPVTQSKKVLLAKNETPKAADSGPSNVADVIPMNNKAYSKHKKGIVEFTHKKHIEDYEIGCGECHHDNKGKALNNLKLTDSVQNCIACHKNPGQAKGKKAKKDKLEFHAEAIHMNCIDCHKDYNKKNNTKDAPSSCNKCHPKN